MKFPTHLATLPYRLHTNRELGLMLKGEKPLALFSDWYENRSDVLERYLAFFDRHVQTGTFVKRDFVEKTRSPSIHVHVFLYSLPQEDWRIDAMIQLRNSYTEWTADHERRFGQLLGYEDWQNDYWLKNHFRPRQA
jgi:hypothetical protein